jgi:hypothetical protein
MLPRPHYNVLFCDTPLRQKITDTDMARNDGETVGPEWMPHDQAPTPSLRHTRCQRGMWNLKTVLCLGKEKG